MEKVPDKLIARTAEIFDSAEGVYSIPLDIRFPFPRKYVAFDLGAAAVDAMDEVGLLKDIGKNPQAVLSIRDQLQEGAKQLLVDWQEKSLRREMTAKLLNLYPVDGFNPN